MAISTTMNEGPGGPPPAATGGVAVNPSALEVALGAGASLLGIGGPQAATTGQGAIEGGPGSPPHPGPSLTVDSSGALVATVPPVEDKTKLYIGLGILAYLIFRK